MTPYQLIAETNRFMNKLERENKAFQLAVSTVHGEMADRIFNDGLAANGRQIGTYSTKAGWFKRAGQTKAKYYPGGYREFKKAIGKPSDKVTLELEASLRNGFQSGLRKVSPTVMEVRMTNADNQNKIEKLEKQYRKRIFAVSKKEEERIYQIIADELNP